MWNNVWLRPTVVQEVNHTVSVVRGLSELDLLCIGIFWQRLDCAAVYAVLYLYAVFLKDIRSRCVSPVLLSCDYGLV